MEDVVRALREGPADGDAAPLALVEDDLQCIGGPAAFCQVVRRLASALAGRSPGGNDILYVGRRGLASLCWPPEAEGKLDFVHATAASSTEGPGLVGLQAELARLSQSSGERQRKCCLVLESLSTLLLQHSVSQVMSMLEEFAGLPAALCMIGLLHTDLHSPEAVFALKRAAKCIVHLEPVLPGLAADSSTGSARIDGALSVQYKRRTGRVQCKREWFQLQRDGSVACFATVKHLGLTSSTAPPSTSRGAVKQTASAPPAGMRTSLTPEELAARAEVLLPYEKGRSVDAAAAEVVAHYNGSRKEQQPSDLGQILYVRDSESEYDSDEDPDDDLDI